MFDKFLGRAFLALGIFAGLATSNAYALDTFLLNTRATGMGGANIACTNDANAQYYNPGAFGFFSKKPAEGEKAKWLATKDWGVDLNFSAGTKIHGDIGNYLEDLANIDFEELSDNGIQSAEDLDTMIRLAKNLSGVDDPKNAFAANATASLAGRVGHLGIGVYGLSQVQGQVLELDTTRLGITATDFSDDIEAQNTSVANNGNYSFVVFSTDQQDQLELVGLTIGAVRVLDDAAAGQGISGAQIQEVVDILDNIAGESLGGGVVNALGDNTTTVVASGFGVVEIPLTYGYAINEFISVGANLKLMRGRVYGIEIRVFDDDNDEALDEVDSNYEETTTFGLDLGVMGRYSMFHFGMVLRNLNAPKFDGFSGALQVGGVSKSYTVPDITFQPQLAIGVAANPLENLTVALDLDLTANDTYRRVHDYDTQYLRMGVEWNAFKFLALRLGFYTNLQESDIGVVYTGGLGLNLWAARFDLSGAISDKTVTFDGDDVPAELEVALRLSVDF